MSVMEVRGGFPRPVNLKTEGDADTEYVFRGAQKAVYINCLTKDEACLIFFANNIVPSRNTDDEWVFPNLESGQFLEVEYGQPVMLPAEFRAMKIRSRDGAPVRVNVCGFERWH